MVAPAPIKDPLTWLYPALEPFDTGMLSVSDGHQVYFEQSGHPQGKPVLFVHGGPGAGTAPRQRRFFDPRRYRIILFDQRGCGKSKPAGSLIQNNTAHLVEDMEALRLHLGIDRWTLFGGSWGSTLSLAYAQAHPHRVTQLILRGIFLGTQREIDWVYQPGTVSALFPEGWQRFVEQVPLAQREDMLGAYARLLQQADKGLVMRAARAWNVWETLLSHVHASPEDLAEAEDEESALPCALLEIHYFQHQCFLAPGQLLAGVPRIAHIPTILVQGRYDLVCPMENAWALHQAWTQADFQVIPDAGHSALEPNTCRALVAAADRFSSLD